MDMKLSKLYDIVEDGEPGVLQSMGLQRARHDLANEQNYSQMTIPFTEWKELGMESRNRV